MGILCSLQSTVTPSLQGLTNHTFPLHLGSGERVLLSEGHLHPVSPVPARGGAGVNLKEKGVWTGRFTEGACQEEMKCGMC